MVFVATLSNIARAHVFQWQKGSLKHVELRTWYHTPLSRYMRTTESNMHSIQKQPGSFVSGNCVLQSPSFFIQNLLAYSCHSGRFAFSFAMSSRIVFWKVTCGGPGIQSSMSSPSAPVKSNATRNMRGQQVPILGSWGVASAPRPRRWSELCVLDWELYPCHRWQHHCVSLSLSQHAAIALVSPLSSSKAKTHPVTIRLCYLLRSETTTETCFQQFFDFTSSVG